MDDGFREIDIASVDRRDLGAGFWSSLESLCEDRETDPQIDRIETDFAGRQRAILTDKVRPQPISGLRWRDTFALFLREHFGMRPSHVAAVIDCDLLTTLRGLQDSRELLAGGLRCGQ